MCKVSADTWWVYNPNCKADPDSPIPDYDRIFVVTLKGGRHLTCSCGMCEEMMMPCPHVHVVVNRNHPIMFHIRWFGAFQYYYGRDEDMTKVFDERLLQEYCGVCVDGLMTGKDDPNETYPVLLSGATEEMYARMQHIVAQNSRGKVVLLGSAMDNDDASSVDDFAVPMDDESDFDSFNHNGLSVGVSRSAQAQRLLQSSQEAQAKSAAAMDKDSFYMWAMKSFREFDKQVDGRADIQAEFKQSMEQKMAELVEKVKSDSDHGKTGEHDLGTLASDTAKRAKRKRPFWERTQVSAKRQVLNLELGYSPSLLLRSPKSSERMLAYSQ